jgi:2-polyprenyl-3-methyl-5-hydroxy-6-metoxy-1,4-benzoquinol methylase
LESLVEVVHFRPDELAAVPASGFDLYLNIDDGFSYPLPDALRPSAWWAIDTHLNFARCRERATGFDFVFAAQRDGAARIEAERIAKATWLPLALDPEIHGKQSVAKQFDVAFVGNVFPGVRAELLDLIRRRYPKSWIGQCYFHEMAKTYSAARTVFNRSIENDVNMRVFEGLASGSLLVTNDLSQNGLAELFQDGVHLATYRGPEELLDKLAFYLGREAVRERIAAAGHAEALANHTYRLRMERLLGEVEATLKTFSANGRPAGVAAESAPKNGQVSGQTELRDSTYFGHARPEVLALVPTGARRVLDVGCGAGRLGEAIKGRQQAEVIGIELNESAAAWARQRLDRVVVGNVEQLDVEFGAGSLDAIVCADILEHLREPERLLLKARTWLAADGSLIASIPNVRHHSVVRSLLQGNWTYESAGLLDRDHVRFFTRREIEKMFFRAGFAIDELRWVGVPGEDRSGQRPAICLMPG